MSFDHNGSGDDAISPANGAEYPNGRDRPDAIPPTTAGDVSLAAFALMSRNVLEGIFRHLGASDLGAVAGVARAWRDEVDRLRRAAIRRRAILGFELKSLEEGYCRSKDRVKIKMARFMARFAPSEAISVYYVSFYSPRFGPKLDYVHNDYECWSDVVSDVNFLYHKILDMNRHSLSISPNFRRLVDGTSVAEELERLRNLAASFPSDNPALLPHLRNLTLWFSEPLNLTLRELVTAAPNLEVLKVREEFFPREEGIAEFMASLESAKNLHSFAYVACRDEAKPLIEALVDSRRDSLQRLFIYSGSQVFGNKEEEYIIDVALKISRFKALKKLSIFLGRNPMKKWFLSTLAKGLGQTLEDFHVIIELKDVDELLKFERLKKLKSRIQVEDWRSGTPNEKRGLYFDVNDDVDDEEKENFWRQHPIKSVNVFLMKGSCFNKKAIEPQPIVNYLSRRWGHCEEFELEKNDEAFLDDGKQHQGFFNDERYERECRFYLNEISKDFEDFG